MTQTDDAKRFDIKCNNCGSALGRNIFYSPLVQSLHVQYENKLAEKEKELKKAEDEKDYWIKNHSQQLEDENYKLRQQLQAVRKQTVENCKSIIREYGNQHNMLQNDNLNPGSNSARRDSAYEIEKLLQTLSDTTAEEESK